MSKVVAVDGTSKPPEERAFYDSYDELRQANARRLVPSAVLLPLADYIDGVVDPSS